MAIQNVLSVMQLLKVDVVLGFVRDAVPATNKSLKQNSMMKTSVLNVLFKWSKKSWFFLYWSDLHAAIAALAINETDSYFRTESITSC